MRNGKCFALEKLLILLNYLLDLSLDLIDKTFFTYLDVQSQKRFGVGRADVETPVGCLERVAIGEIFLSLGPKFFLNFADHRLDVLDSIIEFSRHVVAGGVMRHDFRERLSLRGKMFQYQQEWNDAVVRVKIFS